MKDPALYPIFVHQGRSKTRFKVGYINYEGEVVVDAILTLGLGSTKGSLQLRFEIAGV
jgi:hypothetical protein